MTLPAVTRAVTSWPYVKPNPVEVSVIKLIGMEHVLEDTIAA